MPILYSIKEKNMNNENWKTVTAEHFAAIKKHHKLMSYTNDDLNELVMLVRLYVDPRQASCLTCHNNVREAKNKLNGFYVKYKDLIEQNLNTTQPQPQIEPEILNEVEIAQKQVEEYKEEEKKKRGRKPKTE